MADTAQGQAAPQPLALVNGEWTDTLSLRDRGLAYGDGLFESCRWQKGGVALWPWHWARLQEGAARLAIPLDTPLVLQQFATFCQSLTAQAASEGLVKLTLTRGQGGAGYSPLGCGRPSVIWQWTPMALASPWAIQGVRLVLAAQALSAQPVLAGLKHLNRLEYILAAAHTPVAEGEQLLFLNAQGQLVECLHHNLFWMADGHLCTPILDTAGVAGVFRQLVLQQLAPASGLPVRVAAFSASALAAASEVFITNSLRGIWPVTAFMQHRWACGPVTQQLQALEDSLWSGVLP